MREFKTGDRVLVLLSGERTCRVSDDRWDVQFEVREGDSICGDVQETTPLIVRVGEWWFSVSQCVLLEPRKRPELRLVMGGSNVQGR